MMKTKTLYVLAFLLLPPAGLAAQTQQPDTTLNRTVVVEQEYAPHIRDAAKVNVLPRVEEPVVSQKAVEYDNTLSASTFIPADTLQAFAGQETPSKPMPGYLRVGYGNYGNLDARADYLFRFSAKDQLRLTLDVDGTDGKLDRGEGWDKWNVYDYHTRAAVDYIHRFQRVDLDAAARFGLRNFNRLPDMAPGKQKFTSGDVHIGVVSTEQEKPVQFRAETNLLLYQRQHGYGYEDAQEAIVRTRADVWGALSEGQSVGIVFRMDNLIYQDIAFENYTALGLAPYYAYRQDNWDIRAGLHIDPSLGFGEGFRLAPDIRVQYAFPARLVLYAQAKGGKLLNDFRRLADLSPYAEPAAQLDATYEQINAAAGIKVGTLSGFWAHLYGGYQVLKDETYFTALPMGGNSYALGLSTWNMNNSYVGGELSYSYRDIVTFRANGLYRNWSLGSDGSESMLAFKPTAEADVKLEVHPIAPLRLHVGYRTICWTKVEGERMDPVSNLYAGATYDLFQGFGLYARLDNLLNKDYRYDWFYPTEGFNLVAGLTFRF